ncbi:MAG: hypothetical protein ACP5N3_05270 [Candidatus Nanoarchaeia archaeon]
MKIEVDTIADSVDELKEAVDLIQEALERRTGITKEKVRAPLRPSEFKKEEPKVIFEDIMSTAPLKKTIQSPPKSKEDPAKKRKVLKQDERAPEEEEEDEDRRPPQIQYRDYW